MKRASLALPLALYLAGVALLGGWIIDDAGISFAYARNFGRGFGFVAQPGQLPVEGFSNFLWVVLLSPLARWSWFDPLFMTRLLSALALFACFAVIRRVVADFSTGMAASLLIAAAPPIVIWTSSGLENGLMLLLGMMLWGLLVERPQRWAPASGVVAGLMAATHPEGILYVAVAPLVIGLGAGDLRSRARDALRSLAGWTAIVVPLLALRLAVFHLPLPHTWYAKRVVATPWARLADLVLHPTAMLGRVVDLAHGFAGPLGPGLLVGGWLAVALLARRRALPRWLGVATVLQLVAIGAFVLIDEDWMGEYRFGTMAVATSALVVVGALGFVIGQARVPRAAGPAALALAMLVAALGVPRLWRFAANPPTPLAEVDRLWRQKLDAWARALEIRGGSAFLADVGAPLWSSSLRVIDAAGLCEPQVIKTLKANGTAVDWRLRSPAFYDWIFETAKPTFVATHLFWTVVTQLDRDPRWLRDYVAIDAYYDSYALQVYGVTSRSGVWVRRDALIVPRALERLRALHAAPRSEPFVWRLVDALGGTPPADAAKLAQAAWNARFQERDLHRAATLWQRALEREPDHLANLQLLAETLDGVSRVDEARAVWHRLREAATRAGAAAPLAAAHDRLDRPDEETEEVLWMNGAVDALYTRRDAGTAIRLLERLLARTPDHYGANFQLARALKLAGRRDEARAQFARSLEMASKIGDEPTAKLAREELAALTGTRTLNQ